MSPGHRQQMTALCFVPGACILLLFLLPMHIDMAEFPSAHEEINAFCNMLKDIERALWHTNIVSALKVSYTKYQNFCCIFLLHLDDMHFGCVFDIPFLTYMPLQFILVPRLPFWNVDNLRTYWSQLKINLKCSQQIWNFWDRIY